MARVNIEENWWVDPRREKLAKLLGDELLADGAVIRLWRIAQEYWKNSEPIPNHVFEHVRYGSEIVACGLAISNEQGVYVRGSTKSFEWLQKRKDAASKAGKKSAESRKKTKGTSQPLSNQTRTKVNEEQPNTEKLNQTEPSSSFSSSSSYSLSKSKSGSNSSEVPNGEISSSVEAEPVKLWDTYSSLWKQKYNNQTPLRNAKVNSQLNLLSKRVPAEEVEKLIQFYLRHPKPYYIQQMHAVGPLLADCEALVAQMRTGAQVMNGLYPMTKAQSISERNDEVFRRHLAVTGGKS